MWNWIKFTTQNSLSLGFVLNVCRCFSNDSIQLKLLQKRQGFSWAWKKTMKWCCKRFTSAIKSSLWAVKCFFSISTLILRTPQIDWLIDLDTNIWKWISWAVVSVQLQGDDKLSKVKWVHVWHTAPPPPPPPPHPQLLMCYMITTTACQSERWLWRLRFEAATQQLFVSVISTSDLPLSD